MNRLDFHLEIIHYLIYENRVSKPLKSVHYADYVPQKRKYLEENSNDNLQQSKKDFRLSCKSINCKRKTDLYCPGCSNKNYICSLCIPDCFIYYHSRTVH